MLFWPQLCLAELLFVRLNTVRPHFFGLPQKLTIVQQGSVKLQSLQVKLQGSKEISYVQIGSPLVLFNATLSGKHNQF